MDSININAALEKMAQAQNLLTESTQLLAAGTTQEKAFAENVSQINRQLIFLKHRVNSLKEQYNA